MGTGLRRRDATCVTQVITPKTGEAFLKLRLKDQSAALKLLDDDPNLKGRCYACAKPTVPLLAALTTCVALSWALLGRYQCPFCVLSNRCAALCMTETASCWCFACYEITAAVPYQCRREECMHGQLCAHLLKFKLGWVV